MWRWRVRTEKQSRDQAQISDAAGKIPTASIKSTPIKCLRVTGDFAVATEDSSPIVGIGNDHDIGLVISRAGNHPRLHLARVVGRAQVCVADTAADLETAEFVSQKDVDHPCHRITAINGRGPILQDIDVINHWEWNEIDIHAGDAGHSSSATPNYGSALSIDKNQGFFRQQTTQIRYDAAVAAIGNVLVDGRAHLLRQLDEQVGC